MKIDFDLLDKIESQELMRDSKLQNPLVLELVDFARHVLRSQIPQGHPAKVCPYCTLEFFPARTHPNQQTCAARACQLKWQSDWGKGRAPRIRPPRELVCSECKNSFETKASTTKTCSQICADRRRSRLNKEKRIQAKKMATRQLNKAKKRVKAALNVPVPPEPPPEKVSPFTKKLRAKVF